jgi:type II secretory pathway component PulF
MNANLVDINCDGCHTTAQQTRNNILPAGWTIGSKAAAGAKNYSEHRRFCPSCSAIQEIATLQTLNTASVSIEAGTLFLYFRTGKLAWLRIHEQLRKGTMLSEAFSSNPLPDLKPEDMSLLTALSRAGELGGVLDIVLERFTLSYFMRHQGKLDDVAEFLHLVGTQLTCGVPILEALKSAPARSTQLTVLKAELDASVRQGDSVYTPLLKVLSQDQADLIREQESTGALPDAILHVADLRSRMVISSSGTPRC